jgi:hypothetical protein
MHGTGVGEEGNNVGVWVGEEDGHKPHVCLQLSAIIGHISHL